MDKHVRLVFVPGNPVTLDSLSPKTHLLMLQGRLAAEGVPADIIDFGALEQASNVACVDAGSSGQLLSGWVEQMSQGWGGFPLLLRLGKDPSPQQTRKVERASWLSEGSPRVVAFWVEDRDGFRQTKELSKLLRHCLPGTAQALTGPFALHFGTCALSGCPSLDAVITGDAVQSLVGIVDQNSDKQDWRSVPGVLYRDAEGNMERSAHSTDPASALPLRFNMLNRKIPSTQFPLYPLSFALQPSGFYYQDSNATEQPAKSAEALFQELDFFQRHSHANAFHISAPHVPIENLSQFADMILKQNLVAIYSLGDISNSIHSVLAERLFASGCRSIGFRVPTGSQRILEDFYGSTASVSAMRATLRNCRAAGIFTVLRMCYPCSMDDYHTRAEIELFVEASNPNSVCVEAPVLTPDSLWFRRPSDFGFFISHKDFQRHALGGETPYGAFPYTMRGWNSRRIFQAQASLSEAVLRLGCMVDVTEQQGLMGRIVRSMMEESDFLAELQDALEHQDTAHLQKLAEIVNANAQTLTLAHAPAGEFLGKTASCS